jgi:hypothetical protein
MRTIFISIVSFTLLYSDDYGFDFDELDIIETKPYEYSGYIRGEFKYLDKSNIKDYSELLFNYSYFRDNYTFISQTVANYTNSKSDTILNQLFLNYKYSSNSEFNFGKRALKWGKGYYFNPVAFIDREKDPNNPELSKEGFISIGYRYNEVFYSSLKNFSFDILYLKKDDNLNSELDTIDSDIFAFKSYFLYYDIDIDFIYFYSVEGLNKCGVDFSTNIETNFEIHSEFAKYESSFYLYLIGLKYLTESELTILSEYYYKNETKLRSEPFWDKKYLINSFTQKEPFDTLYLNIYYKNSLNLSDKSYQDRVGFLYSGVNNLDIDFSIIQNSGNSSSEFGSKSVNNYFWLDLKYSF